jgi:outer membrane lipase/esterase
MKVPLIRTLIGAAGLMVAMAAPLQAHAYANWFVFGDSLSDSGNNAILLGIDAGQVIDGNSYIPTYPYASGRYSNSEIWTRSFAASLGLQAAASLAGGNIYAYGGARTRVVSPDGAPPLRDQVKDYLGDYGGAADGSALYVIAGGGNNARDTLDAIGTGEVPILRTMRVEANRYATDVGRMVDRLQAAGAEHIVVWNTPDISRAPAVIAEGDLAVGLAAQVAGSMNSALSKRLNGEEGVVIFDAYALFDRIVDHGADYGLVNTSDACGAIVGCDPTSYLFWDGIHPTSAGHQLLADAMLEATPVPEPAMVWLFAAGLGVLCLRQRVARPPLA